MSLWSRIANVLRGDRLNREIDEEFESHIAEAIEQGRDSDEARRALGSSIRQREASHDVRIVAWLDSLRADAIFGWRQLKRNKVTSGAAILSLALAIGACTSAFRLIDALLLRPLPVADAQHLYALSRGSIDSDGKFEIDYGWEYPLFQQMRAAVKDQAEFIAVSPAGRTDLTYKSDQEMEKAHLQFVSGWMFGSFGIQPSLGRLFTESDDLTPGTHPYAVLSYDYWTRRFGQDPKVIGRTFHMGKNIYEIIGVAGERFTGTEPGTVTDIFIPTMMNRNVGRSDSDWFRTLVLLKPNAAIGPFRERLQAISQSFQKERLKGYPAMPKEEVENFLNPKVLVEPAAAGFSGMQKDYGGALAALGVLVAMVLLIACANVANLMTAQAAARAREMALRISIGAGRWRLVRLVLVESAMLAFLAGMFGGLLAWWSAPFVVSMINLPDDPARLVLPADWRVLGFGLALTIGVMLLFGLAPALRASAIKPVSALKGGDDPHARRRLMHGLIAIQVAFCFLVLFVAGLFVSTFERLTYQSPGFSPERVLLLDTVTQRPQAPVYWDQVAEHLRMVPGVEKVALAGFPLLSGDSWNGSIAINGGPPSADLVYFLNISPGWAEVMKIPFIDGRDFRSGDTYPGAVIINETFAKQFLHGENPVGKTFERTTDEGKRIPLQIVGFIRDARYRKMREPILPVAYVPFPSTDTNGALQPIDSATFIVRTASADPLTLASTLRREIPRARSEFRVSNIRTQQEIIDAQTIRERLLAMLAMFFASVALLLAGIGLYGVLNYSVLQQQREIGIRMALGAQVGNIARRVTGDVFAMVLAGALLGLVLAMAAARYIESLLYQVKVTDPVMLALPSLTILAVALLSAVPAVIRAVRIDPVAMLRVE